MHTPGEHAYNRIHIMAMDTYTLVFKVKASRSVHIALSVVPTMTRTQTWEIGLQTNGGNENFIRDQIKGSNYLVKNTLGGLLDKNVYNRFYINWANGVRFNITI